jgi:hypothetical protein
VGSNRFVTLGPAGTNHDLAVQRYIAFHGLTDATIAFVSSFGDALDAVRRGEADFIVQVCAHPEVANTIEKHHQEIFLVDSFISPTKAMGVLTRRDVETPRSVGLMIATKGYFDTSRWETLVPETSNPVVAQGLLDGKYDSGFTWLELAAQYPDRFRVDQEIGIVDVAWLVYGRHRTRTGDILAWRDAPVRALFA